MIMVVATLSAYFVPTWGTVDWWIFAKLNRVPALAIDNKVILIDVPWDNLEMFRNRVAGLLKTIAGKSDALPQTVVLDMWFSGEDSRGLVGLEEAIRQLDKDKKVAVYATINPQREQSGSGQHDPDYMKHHAQILYGLLDGVGHTKIDSLYGVAKYEPELVMPGGETFPALPVLIARNYNPSLPTTREPIILKMGNLEELRQRTYTFRLGADGRSIFTQNQANGGGTPLEVVPDFSHKIVVVGSMGEDRPGFRDLSGPEILAFAISERILPVGSARRTEVFAHPILLVVLVALFAVLAASLFWLLFRKLRRFRSRLWVLALLSIGICLSGLALWVLGLFLVKNIYPQVTLVAIGILLSTGLSWFYTQRGLELKLIMPPTEKPAAVEELPAYDVFISYARTPENLTWVKENIYERLLKEQSADGSELRIFFDQRSIEPGVDFYEKLALAIQGSRFFLPVYTSDYFTRDFCKFEIQRAALRHVKLGDFINPIAREAVKIPTQYDHINYLDIHSAPDFMDRLMERIKKRQQLCPI